MDYPCAKFGDFNFSPFSFIVRTDRSHTDRITDADDRNTYASPVGVSNNCTAVAAGMNDVQLINDGLYPTFVYCLA